MRTSLVIVLALLGCSKKAESPPPPPGPAGGAVASGAPAPASPDAAVAAAVPSADASAAATPPPGVTPPPSAVASNADFAHFFVPQVTGIAELDGKKLGDDDRLWLALFKARISDCGHDAGAGKPFDAVAHVTYDKGDVAVIYDGLPDPWSACVTRAIQHDALGHPALPPSLAKALTVKLTVGPTNPAALAAPEPASPPAGAHKEVVLVGQGADGSRKAAVKPWLDTIADKMKPCFDASTADIVDVAFDVAASGKIEHIKLEPKDDAATKCLARALGSIKAPGTGTADVDMTFKISQ